MEGITERGGQVAREILSKRDPYGTELRDNVFVSIMLAEAYETGLADAECELGKVRESLEQIKTIVTLLSGVEHSKADREAALKLIATQAECAALRLEAIGEKPE